MKQKVKAWVRKWLEEEKNDWSPKKERDLKAVCFSSKSAIDGKHYNEYMCHCTEWVNGEGLDFSFLTYNQISKNQKEKNFSLCSEEIDILIACLNDLGRFELD